jgi:hypothetical protein
MLIDGEIHLAVGERGEGRREPVGEGGRDPPHRLAVVAPFERRAAAPGLVRDDHREPLVAGTGPQRRFPEARVADDDHAGGIDLGKRHEPVEDPRQLPGPSGDRPRFIAAHHPFVTDGVTERGEGARPASIGMVREDVAAVGGGGGKPTVVEELHRPAARERATGGCLRRVVIDAGVLAVGHPAGGDADGRIGRFGVVAAEVQMEKRRQLLLRGAVG